MIISHFQARQLLESKKEGLKESEISLDLNMSKNANAFLGHAQKSLISGITKSKIKIEDNFFIFPNSQKIEELQLKKVIKDSTSCFLVENGALIKIKLFSEQTRRFYKLVPTKDAPTLEISGIRMHVTKEMTPVEDTKKKIDSISPIKGLVLDTSMGLGYTAILASKSADFIITVEKDENVLEIAKFNPWSKGLFDNKKISIIKASIFDEIKVFKSNMFDAIIHDPPRLSLATELYSMEFYKQLFRVLKKSGKLYHYTGSPGSRVRKIDLARNVGERLRLAGFKDVKKSHYGLTAKR